MDGRRSAASRTAVGGGISSCQSRGDNLFYSIESRNSSAGWLSGGHVDPHVSVEVAGLREAQQADLALVHRG